MGDPGAASGEPLPALPWRGLGGPGTQHL